MKRTTLFILMLIARFAVAQQSPHGAINIPCESCHSTDSWEMRKDASFSHSSTGFALAGRHRMVQCASCHAGLVFARQNAQCVSCHTDAHKSELGPNCLRCHTMESWIIPDMRQKHQQTRFPLMGKHALAECAQCHERASTQQYGGTPLTCISCHKSDYQATTSPNHVASGFQVDCSRCHNIASLAWPGSFDHNITDFPLTGAHRSVVCSQCHTNNQFTRISTECYSCHDRNLAGILPPSPNHITGNFNHDCRLCHTTTAWKPSTFDHNGTNFPLTGEHRNVTCQKCHLNGNYALTYINCAQCHQTNFQLSTNPNHVTGNFSQNCQSCHSTVAWSPASFDHTPTRFPLTGSHVSVVCASCHTNKNFQLAYTDCYQCHQTQFDQQTNPNHTTGNFRHDCQPCHNTTTWNPATFDHATTKLPLTGKHAVTLCQDCHTSGNYQLAYVNCYQCHQTNYQQSINPNHVTSNISQDCQKCHTTVAWSPASFDHAPTKFPLTGSHIAVACLSCHTNSNFQLAYTDCYQCHKTQFDQQTNPNHTTGNFRHDCVPCHNTTAWSPATFDHTGTRFPLTGKHTTTLCQACHTSGNYQLAYTDCYACHADKFVVSTVYNHAALNFGHDCSPCHTTTVWKPSTFNHDTQYFRINSGAHQGKWTLCTECHTVPTNFQLFSCINCHQHDNKATVDSQHVGRSGYSYTPTSCYNAGCHRGV